jgi:hypothetical protein
VSDENFGSVNYRAALEEARRLSSQLRSDDRRFRTVVLLVDIEGSVQFVRSAFFVRLSKDWLALFAEHHPVEVFCVSELLFFKQFREGKTNSREFDLKAANAFFQRWLGKLSPSKIRKVKYVLDELPVGADTPVPVGKFRSFDQAYAAMNIEDGKSSITEHKEWGGLQSTQTLRIFRRTYETGDGGTSAVTYLIRQTTS